MGISNYVGRSGITTVDHGNHESGGVERLNEKVGTLVAAYSCETRVTGCYGSAQRKRRRREGEKSCKG